VVVTRTGFSGEIGYEIYLKEGSKGDALWERVMAAGRPHNIRAIAPSEIRRIEGGFLNWGSDITLDNNPYEVGLAWLVDEGKKADYIGKKALARIRKEGAKRKLVGVEIHGDKLQVWLDEYWDVLADGRTIGRLTALTYSPRLKKNIGYALVPTNHSKLGTRFRVRTPTGDRDATVVEKPFVDPKKEIPKS
jgi:aminomethyltransferase